MSDLELKDPKDVDGEPHEVALFAGKQVEEVLEAAHVALERFRWAARGAWMSSEYHITGNMPQGRAFDFTPVARKAQDVYGLTAEALKLQKTLTAAASWNPKEV